MSVQSQTPYNGYTANGVTTVFPYGFLLLDKDDLVVTVDGVVKTITTDYTVSGVGSPSGGNVTFLAAPANTAAVLLSRLITMERPTDYQDNGDLFADTVNNDLDRLWLAAQQFEQNDIRSIKLPFNTSTDQTLTQSAAARANKGLKFDSSGNIALTAADPDTSEAVAAASAIAAAASASSAASSASSASTSATNAATSASAAATSAANLPNASTAGANKILTTNTGGNGWDYDAIPTGLLKGNGSAISAAVANTDYQAAQARGTDIASASTINLTTATGDIVDVTGTTTITAITLADGARREVRFTGALTLTHGASLILPTGANITTAAGDIAVFRGYASSVVRCTGYERADGTALAGGGTVGEIAFFAQNTAPTGYLKANGAAVSRTTYAALFAAIAKSATITVTIASPGVVTWTSHGRSANDPVKFTTTGALPTGLTPGTTYYVVGASITTNTFQVSATAGGTAINTSGSQSGTHTGINTPFGDGDGSTTFNVPDLRGEFVRGWDDGRAVDTNRTFGAAQADSVIEHIHKTTLGGSQSVGAAGATVTSSDSTINGGTVKSSGVRNSADSAWTGGTETRPRNTALLPCIKF